MSEEEDLAVLIYKSSKTAKASPGRRLQLLLPRTRDNWMLQLRVDELLLARDLLLVETMEHQLITQEQRGLQVGRNSSLARIIKGLEGSMIGGSAQRYAQLMDARI